MSTVQAIFDAFGSTTAIATATGLPVQTVWDWQGKGKDRPPSIPPWRRPAVLDAAKRLNVTLSEEAVAYLASSERHVGIAA